MDNTFRLPAGEITVHCGGCKAPGIQTSEERVSDPKLGERTLARTYRFKHSDECPYREMTHPHDGRPTSGLETRQWQTPGGHTATMTYREGTSDWNTVSACLVNPMNPTTGDEYHLPSGLSGWGLDVGAHIGSVAVGLLLDNPDLHVVAIEAVPPNVELVRRNLEQNGVASRAIVLAGAAWKGRKNVDVEFGYTGSEVAEVHAYIGSITPWLDAPGDKQSANVPVYSLKDALRFTDGAGFVWAKTDCEGCEHYFFKGPGLRQVGTIEGEWHRRDGDPERFVDQLSATHTVEYSEGIGGGPFKAVSR